MAPGGSDFDTPSLQCTLIVPAIQLRCAVILCVTKKGEKGGSAKGCSLGVRSVRSNPHGKGGTCTASPRTNTYIFLYFEILQFQITEENYYIIYLWLSILHWCFLRLQT